MLAQRRRSKHERKQNDLIIHLPHRRRLPRNVPTAR
jgi:hypothetical protein